MFTDTLTRADRNKYEGRRRRRYRYTVLSVVRIGYYSSYLPILSSLLGIEGGRSRSSRLIGKEASFYLVENIHSLFVVAPLPRLLQERLNLLLTVIFRKPLIIIWGHTYAN